MKIKSIFIAAMLALTVFVAYAADVFDQVGAAIRSGDARMLARYFNTNVDLTIVNQEDVFSKAQAEMVLKDFFAKNTPRSYTIIHQGVSKEGAKYAIGTLITMQGQTYRTYFFVKESSGASYIQELRFEKE